MLSSEDSKMSNNTVSYLNLLDDAVGAEDNASLQKESEPKPLSKVANINLPVVLYFLETRSIKDWLLFGLSVACVILLTVAVIGWLPQESQVAETKKTYMAQYKDTPQVHVHKTTENAITDDIPITDVRTTQENIILSHLTTQMPEPNPTNSNSIGELCGKKLSVELKAIGMDDTHPTAGNGYIKVNGQVLWALERHHRGIYLATYDPLDLYFRNATITSYDTWKSTEDATELNDYIGGLPQSSFVLGVTMDSADNHIYLASEALSKLGLDNNAIAYRNSIAFVSKIGSGVIEKDISDRFTGPSIVNTYLETRPCGCQKYASVLNGAAVYLIEGGLENGRIVNIHGYTKPNPRRISFNLWSNDKTKIVMHHDIRHDKGTIVINSLRNATPSSFPNGDTGSWDSEVSPLGPIPVEGNMPFNVQISAPSSSTFSIKIDTCYEKTFRNRLRVPLHNITWMAVNQKDDSLFVEHICIW